ncbi:hypothetical protein L3X38_041233 [Prunus dulcis]|uniref:Uncharacterized protein n=1 Tax=Prunus dulcis TaxID=3755 RepID=A0AAD4USB5_PRUDU|nr:hypothetical protein L3X38_041233 [Prunus dulcis]
MNTRSGLNRSKEKERKKARTNGFFRRLSMLVHGRRSHQDPSQAMVGSNSHTEADRSAGDPCPPYKLIHGNTKEISHMMKEAMARPKTISHDTLPLVQPHVH